MIDVPRSSHMHWAQVRGSGIEAVCFLTLLIRDWIIESIVNPGETGEQWRDGVMQVEMKMSLSVKALPMRLRLRIRPASV
ncbi:hypothetical protein BGW80DRAFT_1302767, partial [Lactifluus volemus]